MDFNAGNIQEPWEMLERWDNIPCTCDPDSGHLCEICHDTEVVRAMSGHVDYSQLVGKQGVPAENLKGLDNGRFTVLRRTSPTTKNKQPHWVISCNTCGQEKVSVTGAIKRNAVACKCRRKVTKRKGEAAELRIPRSKSDYCNEAKVMCDELKTAIDCDHLPDAMRIVSNLVYRVKRALNASL